MIKEVITKGDGMDKLIGVTAASYPFWFTHLEGILGITVGLLGVCLMLYRFRIARKEDQLLDKKLKDES